MGRRRGMTTKRGAAPLGAALLGSLATLFFAEDAVAYCRTTTCDPQRGDECRRNADGCVRDGAGLRWGSMPIVYRFQIDGSERLDTARSREAIRRAFDTWENVSCGSRRTSLRFEEGPPITSTKPLRAKQAKEPFGIYFRDESWPHDEGEDSLALTNQIYGMKTGTIEYADVEINTASVRFATSDREEGVDLQAVMTHEVGHYIGLAHSNEQGSIMQPRYCEDDQRCGGSVDEARSLSDDDVLAVCTLYPPRGAGDDDDDEDSSPGVPSKEPGACATSAGGPGSGGLPACLLAIAAAIASARRKR